MASGQGVVIFDFGAAPGTNVVTTAVADANMGATSNIEIYLKGVDSTADHNTYEHAILKLGGFEATPIEQTAGVGFTAQAATLLRLTGQIKARYVFADI
jgi:hypothetical protein